MSDVWCWMSGVSPHWLLVLLTPIICDNRNYAAVPSLTKKRGGVLGSRMVLYFLRWVNYFFIGLKPVAVLLSAGRHSDLISFRANYIKVFIQAYNLAYQLCVFNSLREKNHRVETRFCSYLSAIPTGYKWRLDFNLSNQILLVRASARAQNNEASASCKNQYILIK